MHANIGKLPSKVQAFLLSILQDKSRSQYLEALTAFKTDLDNGAVLWHDMSEAEQDEWLAEYTLESKEAGVHKPRMQILSAALHKIYPRRRYTITCRVLEVWQHELPV